MLAKAGRRRTIKRVFWFFIVCLLVYAFLIEPKWIQVNRYDVYLSGLPPNLDGIKIVQISDLHRCSNSSDEIIKKAVRLSNAEKPDIVVLTGDFVSRTSANAPLCVADLAGLNAPMGIYAVLGNHDHWHGVTGVKNALEKGDIHVLNNANQQIRQGLFLIGIDDAWAGKPNVKRAYSGVDTTAAQVVLSHTPVGVYRLRRKHCFLITGHTHGGQVMIPFIPRNRLPGLIGFPYIRGWYDVGGVKMYVNRGIGMISPRARFLCRPEVTVFTLRSKPAKGQ